MMQDAESAPLSTRQAEIVKLVVSGKSTREIALALTLSPRTIETHIAAIYNKYGVSTRAELMLAVLGRGAAGRTSANWSPADEEKTNLPVGRELVGRATDIVNILGLLRANPFVTLTGAGGIGKTQAALTVGDAALGQFRDGVWLVELATPAHGLSVGEALARALSIQSAKEQPLIDAIIAYLQKKQLLLIVDNCEHVIGEVAAFTDALLRSCPGLKILATSREPLRIAGEQTYRLPSLAVPAHADIPGLRAARGAEYAAIELFVQRARAVDFAFALSDENTPLVAEICRKLDGIPLAIELAAARVNILSLGALATRIDSHLQILAGGDRLALPRHQTMRALIDWSYLLLAPAEQRLFECIAVFVGGCTLEGAMAVYSEKPHDEFAILNLLASLVDKSLLIVDRGSGEPRYSLLQSFGQYALEKLESHGESSIVRRRHAHAYTVLAERLEEQYDVAPTRAWFSRVESEFENFLVALDWSLGAGGDVVIGQRLAAAMRPVWANVARGRSRLHIARDLADERTPPLLAARLDHAAASAEAAAREHKAALATSLRLIAVYRDLGEPLRAASAQSLAAFTLLLLGRLADAEPLLAPALEVARAHGRATLIAFLLRASSHLSALRGDLRESREKLSEALAIYERIGAERLATNTLGQLGELEFQLGNVGRAFELAARCLHLQRAQGSRTLVQGLANIAAYSVALNRWESSRAYSREALALAQEARDVMSLIFALQHLAAVAVLSVNDDASLARPAQFFVSLSVCAPTVMSAALVARTQAALLLGYVRACTNRLGVAREYTEQQEYDRILAALHATVAADDLARLLAEGALMRPEQAIELALAI